MNDDISAYSHNGCTCNSQNPNPQPASTGTPSLSADVLFSALSASQRRYILQYLSSASTTVTLTGLIEAVAAWETNTDTAEPAEAARTTAAVALQHVHLPKLADAGLVSFDPDQETVALTANATLATPHLELLAGNKAP